VAATNTSFIKSYSWLDNAPNAGVNFYRLKMVDKDGVYKYSNIARVDLSTRKGISVYPNPVANHTIQLQMAGQPGGNYSLYLYNTNGEKLMSSSLIHDGNSTVKSITPDAQCVFCRWQPDRGWFESCKASCSALATVRPETVLDAALNLAKY